MASLVGKTLKNRYRVDEFLGRGGMAEVYRVFDKQRSVPLAMKVLRDDLAEDRVFMRRFAREAQNLTRLQHPNIVRCYGLEQEGRLAYMLMDYIDGSTLRAVVSSYRRPLSYQHILEILKPICSALDYAHKMGIVHCDVKSGNIMIDKNGMVYLTDFGIARGIDSATSTMVGIGTPAYMAPELILEKDPLPQTDVYALGILLYEMLTGGERPYTGERAGMTGTTAAKVRWEHLKLDPIPVREYNPNVPQALEEVVIKAIHKKIAGRYTSTWHFLVAAGQALNIDINTVNSRTSIMIPDEPGGDGIGGPKQLQQLPQNAWMYIAGAVVFIILLFAMFGGSDGDDSSDRTSSSGSSASNVSNSSSSSSRKASPVIDLWAEDTSISSGSCTHIYWDVDNAQDVYFDGAEVNSTDSARVCPDSSSTYDLTVKGEDGDVYYEDIYIKISSSSPAATKTSKPASSTCEGEANDNNINIRNGPEGDYISCCLGVGDDVVIYEVDSSGKWGRIKSERGHSGWVYLKYIDIESSCNMKNLD